MRVEKARNQPSKQLSLWKLNMGHTNEYHQSVVKMLEVIWGKGYMAPGRAGNVKKMLEGIPTAGKNILDIGSGLGGPAIDMSSNIVLR